MDSEARFVPKCHKSLDKYESINKRTMTVRMILSSCSGLAYWNCINTPFSVYCFRVMSLAPHDCVNAEAQMRTPLALAALFMHEYLVVINLFVLCVTAALNIELKRMTQIIQSKR